MINDLSANDYSKVGEVTTAEAAKLLGITDDDVKLLEKQNLLRAWRY